MQGFWIFRAGVTSRMISLRKLALGSRSHCKWVSHSQVTRKGHTGIYRSPLRRKDLQNDVGARLECRILEFHSNSLVHGELVHKQTHFSGMTAAELKQTALDGAKTTLKAVESASNTARDFMFVGLRFFQKYIEGLDSNYKEAVALRIEAFCRRNHIVILAALGSGASLLLWQLTFGICNLFVGFSDGSMQPGLLIFAASSVVCTGVALKTRYKINPDAVYNVVMRNLQASAGLVEVLGDPIVGGKARAYVTSGGALKLKDFRPKVSCNRCFIVFPIQGYERRGMVTSEIIKDKGQYHVKLLAVDIPMPDSDERLYLVGNERVYEAAGGFLGELRDPIVKAIAAEQEFDALDEIDAEESRKQQNLISKSLAYLKTSIERLKVSKQSSFVR